jgi:2-dehydro-3-deoxyphosphogluconate aldolase/(4S)-4-hydroxy-2-oxoglutarate aldolase
MSSLDSSLTKRLVPVAVINRLEDAVPLANALLEGGLDVIEVTLRTPVAMDCIAAIRKECPKMVVGAGTVIDIEPLARLADLGVQFGVSPGLNPVVVEAAQKVGIQMIPGVITPTEFEKARALGLKILKFFPAEAAGGAKMLKALAGPYGHTGIRFVPTGGISLKLLSEYLAVPTVAAVGGSWFVDGALIKEGKFAEITKLTREALAISTAKA